LTIVSFAYILWVRHHTLQTFLQKLFFPGHLINPLQTSNFFTTCNRFAGVPNVGVVPTATAAATTATATTNDPNERKEAKRNVQKDLIALTNTKCNIPKNSPMPANKKPKRTTEKELVTTRLPPTAVNLGKHPPKDWVVAEAAAAAAAAAVVVVVAVAVAVAGTVGTLVTLNWRRHLRGRVVVPVETVLFVPINTPPVCLPQSLVSV
jgi:hypothetical protein